MRIRQNLSTMAVIAASVLFGHLAATFATTAIIRASAANGQEQHVARVVPEPATATVQLRSVELATPSCCTANERLLAMANLQLQDKPAASGKKPNILVIMGDDVGIWNIGAYHRGMMAGRTPHLDKLAAEGMLFTDYYAEASCTAGRANFITGQLPKRTGMTTVGQAGALIGLPAQAPISQRC